MLKKSNGYRSLMRGLTSMSEDEVRRALELEMATERRLSVAERLHQRLCRLRYLRERADLMRDLKV
jgi:hypothetical protein